MEKLRLLILCTGNSCRSQMAEGLVNHFLGGRWQAYSAGVAPSDSVHPLAIEAMAELDIDLSGRTPKSVESYRDLDPDLVVTVCDSAAENCPAWVGWGEKTHMPVADPTKVAGTEPERMEACRRVRDQLREQLLTYLQTRPSGRE